MPKVVWTWIATMKRKAKPGDLVSILLHCHGDTRGSIVLGENHVRPQDFTQWIAGFDEDVYVNVVFFGCHSDGLIECIRNAGQKNRYVTAPCKIGQETYTNAYILSLTKQDPSIPNDNFRQIEDHESFMKERLRKVTPGQKQVPPQFYSSVNSPPTLEERMFRDESHVPYDPTTHNGSKITWPQVIMQVRDWNRP